MKKITIIVLVLLLSGCAQTSSMEELVDELNNDPIEVINHLGSNFGKLGFGASITDSEIILTDEDSTLVVDMPKDEFYLAVAPYINTTHNWLIHSATGCSGELKEETMNVKVTDMKGNIVLDKEVKTLENGFFEIWLPREIEGIIVVNYDGLETKSLISTFEGDLTCLTSMELK